MMSNTVYKAIFFYALSSESKARQAITTRQITYLIDFDYLALFEKSARRQAGPLFDL